MRRIVSSVWRIASGCRTARPGRVARGLLEQSVPAEAERVAGGVEEDPPHVVALDSGGGVARLARGLGGPERQDCCFGRVYVVDLDVDVELLGPFSRRPIGRLVVVHL